MIGWAGWFPVGAAVAVAAVAEAAAGPGRAGGGEGPAEPPAPGERWRPARSGSAGQPLRGKRRRARSGRLAALGAGRAEGSGPELAAGPAGCEKAESPFLLPEAGRRLRRAGPPRARRAAPGVASRPKTSPRPFAGPGNALSLLSPWGRPPAPLGRGGGASGERPAAPALR